MEQPPFETPPTQGGLPPSPPDVLGKVKPPAIALMVLGILQILMGLFTVVTNALMTAGVTIFPQQQGNAPRLADITGGGFGIVQGIIVLVFAGLIIFGALKMMRLKNWGLALTAAILAMLPCSLCCLLGLPFGIWSLVVLLDNNVKAAFR